MNIQNTCEKILKELKTDPQQEITEGDSFPKEYLYTLRLVGWLKKINPSPSDELLIAAHGQHLYRWRIPRSTYPMDRGGYLMWRKKLLRLHAEETAKILSEDGFSEAFINRVRQLILKDNLTEDPEVQCLEDAINLSFIQYYMMPFAPKYEKPKLLDITLKVLRKMTPEAIQTAMTISMPDSQRELITEALQILGQE